MSHDLREKATRTHILSLTLLYESGKWHIWIPRACGYVLMSDGSLDEIAQRDGISPPTRQGLETTLKALNGLDSLEGTQWNVIRW